MTLTPGVRIMTDCRNCKHYTYEEVKGITVNIIKIKCAMDMEMMNSLDCPKFENYMEELTMDEEKMECNKTPIAELVVNKLLDYNTDLRDLHRDMEFLKEFLCEYFEVEQKDIILNGRVTVVVDKIDIEMMNKLSNIREKTNSISIEIKPFTRIPDRVGIDFIIGIEE